MIKFFVKFLIWTLSLFCLNSLIGASYSYWLYGWRKPSGAKSEDVLVLETPSYIFSLNPKDMTSSYFAPSKDGFKYGSYNANYKDIERLKKYPLNISIKLGSDKYVAKQSRSGRSDGEKRLQDVLLWEAGRYCQRYQFKDVEFINSKGEVLPVYADLMLTGWDDVFALSLDMQRDNIYTDGVTEGVVGTGHCIDREKLVISGSELKANDEFTLSFWLKLPKKFWQAGNRVGQVLLKGKHSGVTNSWGIKVEDIYRYTAYVKNGEGEPKTVTIKEDWNLLTLKSASGKFSFYLNGKLVSSQGVSSFSLNGDDLIFGANSLNNKGAYSMVIDEIKFWDKGLSESDIRDMASDPRQSPMKENLVYEKNFNELKLPTTKYKDLKNAEIEISLLKHKAIKKLPKDLAVGEHENLHLPVHIKKADNMDVFLKRDGSNIDVVFDDEKQCFKAVVSKLNNKGASGTCYYADFDLSVKGRGQAPFLLHIKNPGAITGLIPMLCYKDGTPTGIQVQLSKNWHDRILGSYLMAYAKIPQGDYILRISYGFYGKYPSASHAQLSLIGYGGSGRWEQLAVGAWGETICYDADNSLVTNMITDIRMLMARDGESGKKWGWTDAGWGGDWLRVSPTSKTRLMPVGLKTTYAAQGTCLTDVTYEGFLGEEHEVSMRARIQLARTADYARIFHKLDYKFNDNVEADSYSLFNLRNMSKTVALGDKSGAVNEYTATGSSSPTLDFAGDKYPIWFSAMGREPSKIKAVGYKAFVIRSFSAKIGGKTYKVPEIFFNEKKREVELIAPKQSGRMSFKKGDYISMDLELITLHARAEDYYGEDEEYIKHLTANPMSYKTTQREALGNDLVVQVKGGELLRNYPIEILAKDREVAVEIEGGLGLVPLRVTNIPKGDYSLYQILDNNKREKLDQSVAGNDYYQLEYDEYTQSFTYVFNLPLNGGRTRWILKK